jgi:hypothetical protein
MQGMGGNRGFFFFFEVRKQRIWETGSERRKPQESSTKSPVKEEDRSDPIRGQHSISSSLVGGGIRTQERESAGFF